MDELSTLKHSPRNECMRPERFGRPGQWLSETRTYSLLSSLTYYNLIQLLPHALLKFDIEGIPLVGQFVILWHNLTIPNRSRDMKRSQSTTLFGVNTQLIQSLSCQNRICAFNHPAGVESLFLQHLLSLEIFAPTHRRSNRYHCTNFIPSCSPPESPGDSRPDRMRTRTNPSQQPRNAFGQDPDNHLAEEDDTSDHHHQKQDSVQQLPINQATPSPHNVSLAAS